MGTNISIFQSYRYRYRYQDFISYRYRYQIPIFSSGIGIWYRYKYRYRWNPRPRYSEEIVRDNPSLPDIAQDSLRYSKLFKTCKEVAPSRSCSTSHNFSLNLASSLLHL